MKQTQVQTQFVEKQALRRTALERIARAEIRFDVVMPLLRYGNSTRRAD
jgi:hypothetical protein